MMPVSIDLFVRLLIQITSNEYYVFVLNGPKFMVWFMHLCGLRDPDNENDLPYWPFLCWPL